MKKFAAVAVLMGVVGCSGDKTAQEESGSAPAAATAPVTLGVDPELSDITRFRLTMDRMDKYIRAQTNVGDSLKAMTSAERSQASIATNPDASVDQMVAEAEANPLLRNAAEKAGLSTREYIMIAISYAAAVSAASEIESQPNANQDSLAREMQVNPENIRFIRENEAELARKYGGPEGELVRLGIIERVR